MTPQERQRGDDTSGKTQRGDESSRRVEQAFP